MHRRTPATTLPLLFLVASLPFMSGCSSRVAEAKARATVETAVVQSIEVKEEPTAKIIRLTGSLEAQRDSDVAAAASGRVIATFVERGQYVKKGTVLARLDSRDASIAASQAKADAEAARADARLRGIELGRTEKLVAQRTVADAELDRARSVQEVAEQRASAADARFASQNKSLGDAFIRAPFDGIVGERWIDEGEYVRPDTRVISLVDVDTLRLKLTLPEADAHAVRTGQRVAFRVASAPGVDHEATVRFISPLVRSSSRDLVVEAMVDNPEHALKPGMFATARIEAGQQNSIVIPFEALKAEPGNAEGPSRHVFVVAAGRLEERVVQMGERSGGGVIVVSGLQGGERLVTPVTDNLRDGLAAQ